MNGFFAIQNVARVISMLLAIVLAGLAPAARAGFPEPPIPLSTEPLQPFSNQVFDVVFTLDGCGDAFPGYSPSKRIVDISGQVLRVVVAHEHEFCFPGQPPPPSYRWDLGPLAAGTYHLELYGHYYQNDPGDPGNWYLLSSGEVTVRPGLSVAPAVVPTNDPVVLVVLMMLVGGAGLLAVATGFQGKSGL